MEMKRTNAFRKGAMPKNIIVSKGNINYILKLSIVHHEEHYFLLRFARISFTRSFTFHFIVKIKLSRGRKNRIRCSWKEKKKERKKEREKFFDWLDSNQSYLLRALHLHASATPFINGVGFLNPNLLL